MVSRERLLAWLQELVYTEEGMITVYANFSKALVRQAEGIEENKKREIEKLLSRLYRDSSRHKEIIDSMIEQVEAGSTDEY